MDAEWVRPGCDARVQPSDVRRHASECEQYATSNPEGPF